jgi:cold shock CspA family protein
MRGTMLWFNEEQHHGVITSDEGERIPVLRTGFVESAPEGSVGGLPVEFDVVEDGDGLRAERVRLLPQVEQRRARRRGSHFR